MGIINTKNLSCAYGNKTIVNDINFSIDKGEILTIVGPNGSGKSTILKTLSGYIPYANGKIEIENRKLKSYSKRELSKIIAFLPQIRNIKPDISVEKLVSYGRNPHKKTFENLNAFDYEIIDNAIKVTGLGKLRERLVAGLSGGECQRVWIAMALAQEPEILLLDEPTTFLDMRYQLELMELIKKLNKELNLTVVMVLHDINLASRYSDYCLPVVEGKSLGMFSAEQLMDLEILERVFKVTGNLYEDQVNRCKYFIANTKEN